MSKTFFMETTKISPEQTVGEIQQTFCRYGAKAIQLEYEDKGIKAVKFVIDVNGQNAPFLLPCRWNEVHTALINRMRKVRQSREEDYILQAKRIAWRQIFRWIEAQLALVETNMVRIEEVFMPYLVVNKKGETLYEQISNNGFKGSLLEAPK